jgi:PAS domain S-box-containing protein
VFKASRGIEDIYELTYIRKDGSRFPAVVSVTALRDAQDAIIGYLLIGTDNTARKQVEAEQKKLDQRLRDQQFYTRSLIESNIDALMTTDPSGIITDVNKQMEALTGCTRDELIGAPFKNLLHRPGARRGGIKLVLSEKKVTDYELTARARDGKKTVVSYNATTFYDRDRTLQGVFAAARDVTERKRSRRSCKQAKAVAESASRTKSDFLASMSHEIRTPMNAIMGIADLLAKTTLSAEQDKYVQIFRRAGDNLLNLINDILDLSKVEASQLELERTGFSLNDLLEKVTEMVAVRAHEKGLSWSARSRPTCPSTWSATRPGCVRCCSTCSATRSSSPSRDEVSLRCARRRRRRPDRAALHGYRHRHRHPDREAGPGVRAIHPGRLLDHPQVRRLGLGLTISKRLVELMGGRIWVESDGRTGAACSPSPCRSRSGPRPARRGRAGWRPRAPSPPLPALRILLVEDSPTTARSRSAYLEDTPYRVEIAENGALACEMFAAGHYDLVLMDRQMPVMDGLTATRKIRAWEQGERPGADADHRADGLGPEGRPRDSAWRRDAPHS